MRFTLVLKTRSKNKHHRFRISWSLQHHKLKTCSITIRYRRYRAMDATKLRKQRTLTSCSAICHSSTTSTAIRWLTRFAVLTWTEFKKESHLSERTQTALKGTHSMWSTPLRCSTRLKTAQAHLNWANKGLAPLLVLLFCQTHSCKTKHKITTILNQLTKF